MLFLRADHETLLKRYSETRRRHPLSREGVGLAESFDRSASCWSQSPMRPI